MTFNSMDELKNYILSHSRVAIEQAHEIIYGKIAEFLFKFYDEYEPSLYQRTLELLNSCVKDEVKSTGNGWVAEVYFDASKMNHSIKTLQGIGSWANKGWSEEQILETVLEGDYPHGGYELAKGKPIWEPILNMLDAEAIDTLKQELIDAGIPVR